MKLYDFQEAIDQMDAALATVPAEQQDDVVYNQVDAALQQFIKDMAALGLPTTSWAHSVEYWRALQDFMEDSSNGLDMRIPQCYLQAYLSCQQNGVFRHIYKDAQAREREEAEAQRRATDNPRARLDALMGRGAIRRIESNKTIVDANDEKLTVEQINDLKSLPLKALRQRAVQSIRNHNSARRQQALDKGLIKY